MLVQGENAPQFAQAAVTDDLPILGVCRNELEFLSEPRRLAGRNSSDLIV